MSNESITLSKAELEAMMRDVASRAVEAVRKTVNTVDGGFGAALNTPPTDEVSDAVSTSNGDRTEEERWKHRDAFLKSPEALRIVDLAESNGLTISDGGNGFDKDTLGCHKLLLEEAVGSDGTPTDDMVFDTVFHVVKVTSIKHNTDMWALFSLVRELHSEGKYVGEDFVRKILSDAYAETANEVRAERKDNPKSSSRQRPTVKKRLFAKYKSVRDSRV